MEDSLRNKILKAREEMHKLRQTNRNQYQNQNANMSNKRLSDAVRSPNLKKQAMGKLTEENRNKLREANEKWRKERKSRLDLEKEYLTLKVATEKSKSSSNQLHAKKKENIMLIKRCEVLNNDNQKLKSQLERYKAIANRTSFLESKLDIAQQGLAEKDNDIRRLREKEMDFEIESHAAVQKNYAEMEKLKQKLSMKVADTKAALDRAEAYKTALESTKAELCALKAKTALLEESSLSINNTLSQKLKKLTNDLEWQNKNTKNFQKKFEAASKRIAVLEKEGGKLEDLKNEQHMEIQKHVQSEKTLCDKISDCQRNNEVLQQEVDRLSKCLQETRLASENDFDNINKLESKVRDLEVEAGKNDNITSKVNHQLVSLILDLRLQTHKSMSATEKVPRCENTYDELIQQSISNNVTMLSRKCIELLKMHGTTLSELDSAIDVAQGKQAEIEMLVDQMKRTEGNLVASSQKVETLKLMLDEERNEVHLQQIKEQDNLQNIKLEHEKEILLLKQILSEKKEEIEKSAGLSRQLSADILKLENANRKDLLQYDIRLHAVQREKQVLQQEYSAKVQDFETYFASREKQFEDTLQSLKEKLKNEQSRYKVIDATVEEQKELISDYENRIADMNNEIQELDCLSIKQQVDFEAQLKIVKSSLEYEKKLQQELHDIATESKKEYSDELEKIVSAKKEIERVAESQERLHEEARCKFENEIGRLKELLQEEKSRMELENDSIVQENNKEKNDLKQKIFFLKDENTRLLQEHDQVVKRNEDTEHDFSMDINRLKEEVKQKEGVILATAIQHKEKVNVLTVQNQSLSKLLDQLKSQHIAEIDRLNAGLTREKELSNDNDRKINQLEVEKQSILQSLKESEQQIITNQSIVKKMKEGHLDEVRNLSQRLKQLEAKHDHAIFSFEESKSVHEEETNRLSDLVKELTAENERYTQKIKDMLDDHNYEKEQLLEKIQILVTEKENSSVEMEALLEIHHKKMEEQSDTIQALTSQNKGYVHELKSIRDEYVKGRSKQCTELQHLQQENAELNEKAQEVRTNYENELKNMQRLLEESQSQNELFIEELAVDKSKYEKETETLRISIQELRMENETLELVVEGHKSEKTSAIKIETENTDRLSRAAETIQSLTLCLENEKLARKTMEDEIAGLQSSIKSKSVKLCCFEQEREDLQSEITKLNETITKQSQESKHDANLLKTEFESTLDLLRNRLMRTSSEKEVLNKKVLSLEKKLFKSSLEAKILIGKYKLFVDKFDRLNQSSTLSEFSEEIGRIKLNHQKKIESMQLAFEKLLLQNTEETMKEMENLKVHASDSALENRKSKIVISDLRNELIESQKSMASLEEKLKSAENKLLDQDDKISSIQDKNSLLKNELHRLKKNEINSQKVLESLRIELKRLHDKPSSLMLRETGKREVGEERRCEVHRKDNSNNSPKNKLFEMNAHGDKLPIVANIPAKHVGTKAQIPLCEYEEKNSFNPICPQEMSNNVRQEKENEIEYVSMLKHLQQKKIERMMIGFEAYVGKLVSLFAQKIGDARKKSNDYRTYSFLLLLGIFKRNFDISCLLESNKTLSKAHLSAMVNLKSMRSSNTSIRSCLEEKELLLNLKHERIKHLEEKNESTGRELRVEVIERQQMLQANQTLSLKYIDNMVKLQHLNTQNCNIQTKLDITENVDALRQANEILAQKYLSLMIQYKIISKEIGQLIPEIEGRDKQIKTLKYENESKDQLLRDITISNQTLTNKCLTFSKRLKHVQKANRALEKLMKEKTVCLRQLEGEVKEYKKEKVGLVELISTNSMAMEKMGIKVKEGQESNRNLELSLADEYKRNQVLENRIAEMGKQFDDSGKEIETLESQLTAKLALNKTLMNRCDNLKAEVDELMDKIKGLVADRADVQKSAATLSVTLLGANIEMRSKNRHVRQLKSTIGCLRVFLFWAFCASRGLVGCYKKQCTTLKRSISTLTCSILDQRKENESKNKDILLLSKRLLDTRSHIATRDKEYKLLQKNNKSLENDVLMTSKQASRVLREVTNTFETRMNTLEKKRIRLQSREITMRAEYEKLKEGQNELCVRAKKLQQEEKECTVLKKNLDQMQLGASNQKAVVGELQSLTAELRIQKKNYQVLQEEYERTRKENMLLMERRLPSQPDQKTKHDTTSQDLEKLRAAAADGAIMIKQLMIEKQKLISLVRRLQLESRELCATIFHHLEDKRKMISYF